MIPDSYWIPVERALPSQYHERVLVVCDNYTNHMQRHVSVCTYFGKNDRGIPVWSGRKHVTHWMPLPELPKEEVGHKETIARLREAYWAQFRR